MIDSVSRKSRSRLDSVQIPAPVALYSSEDEQAERRRLAGRILQRIETRLPGRIRELSVYTTENSIVLSGRCSTYYTKQVAQHTAMGVMEYDRLINNIDVCSPK